MAKALRVQGHFLWIEEWTYGKHEGWTVAVLSDRKKEVRASILKKNAKHLFPVPPKHTPVEMIAVLVAHQPWVKRRGVKASILFVRPIETSGMDAATPEPPGPEESPEQLSTKTSHDGRERGTLN